VTSSEWTAFGPNGWLVEEQYARYLVDPRWLTEE
jgi:hypothetical protein